MDRVNTDVLRILSIYPIFNTICKHLNPGELIAFQATTKRLSAMFDTVYKSQWNVNRLLERFVVDPKTLRCLMARHDALIGGSIAFQFFDRVTWKGNSDLDIYVQAKEEETECMGSISLNEFFLGEGYEVNHMVDEPYELFHSKHSNQRRYGRPLGYTGVPIDHATEITTYERHSHNGGFARVHLIYTPDIPVKTILDTSNSTALLNFLSWNAGFSLFPDMTFVHQKMVGLGYVPYLEKFPNQKTLERHGLERLLSPEIAESKFISFQFYQALGVRRLKDSKTWKVDLDCTDIEEGTPASVFRESFFWIDRVKMVLGEHPDNLLTNQAMREFKFSLLAISMQTSPTFKSCVLRYTYTNSKWDFWSCDSTRSKLTALARSQYLELDKEKRAGYFDLEHELGYDAYAERIRKNPPNGWTFWDDELPKWYEEWIEFKVQELEEETRLEIESRHENIDMLRADIDEQERYILKQENGLDAGLIALRVELASL